MRKHILLGSTLTPEEKFRDEDVPFFRGWCSQTVLFAMGFAAHQTATNLFSDNDQNMEFKLRADREARQIVDEAERLHGNPLNPAMFSMHVIESTFKLVAEYLPKQ